MRQIRKTRRLNRVIINKDGSIEPKINVRRHNRDTQSIYHLDYKFDSVVEPQKVKKKFHNFAATALLNQVRNSHTRSKTQTTVTELTTRRNSMIHSSKMSDSFNENNSPGLPLLPENNSVMLQSQNEFNFNGNTSITFNLPQYRMPIGSNGEQMRNFFSSTQRKQNLMRLYPNENKQYSRKAYRSVITNRINKWKPALIKLF